jgi:histidinol-phosphate aminotransferase
VPGDVLVVLDEAYLELVRNQESADGMDAFRRHDNVALLRTFSKAYGLAGLRVGYGVVREPVASALRTTAVPFGVSSVAQAAALASLDSEEELMQRVDVIVAERERVVGALTSQGWRLPRTQANFVWFGLGKASAQLAQACADAGLVVRTFDGEGVRATIAEPAANDRLIEAAATLAPSLAR